MSTRSTEPLFLDLETDGDRLVCVGYAWGNQPAKVMEWFVPPEVKRAVRTPGQVVITHTKYDLRWLGLHKPWWVIECDLHDTQVMAHLVNETTALDLESLTKRYCGKDMDKRLRQGGKKFECDDGTLVPWEQAPIDQVMEYCKRDVEALRELYYALLHNLDTAKLKDYFFDVGAPFTRVLLDMELRGLPVDLDKTKKLQDQVLAQRDKHEQNLTRDLPSAFNLRSPAQVASHLGMKEWKLKGRVEMDESFETDRVLSALAGDEPQPGDFVVEKTGRKWAQGYWIVQGVGVGTRPLKSVDRNTLLTFGLKNYPWVVEYLAWKKLDKLNSTYLEVFPKVAVNDWGENEEQALCGMRGHVWPSWQKGRPVARPTVLQPQVFEACERCGAADRGQPRLLDSDAARPLPHLGTSMGVAAEVGPSSNPERARTPHQPQQARQQSEEPNRALTGRAQAGPFRIHGRLNQTGTVTGRLSSSDPNLQNIPARGLMGKACRALFTGDLVVGDFSQLEPRLMAHFSQDPVMLDAFNTDTDLYAITAKAVGVSRDVAKVLVLAMGYGAGAEKLALILTVAGFPTSARSVTTLLQRTKQLYKVYFEWRAKTIADARRKGYVSTLDGRKRHVGRGNEWSWKGVDSSGRQAANAVIQGSAADVVARVMLHTSRMFPDLKLVGQVHDEMLWEFDPNTYTPDLSHLQQWVEKMAERGLTVPLKFEPRVGKSWVEAKDGVEPELRDMFV